MYFLLFNGDHVYVLFLMNDMFLKTVQLRAEVVWRLTRACVTPAYSPAPPLEYVLG